MKLFGIKWLIILLAISFLPNPIYALEIRGSVAGTIDGGDNLYDNSFTWTPQNFAGFYYDIDHDVGGDTLTTNLIEYRRLSGDEPYGVTYATTNQMKAFNNAQADMTYGKLRVASINATTGEILMDNRDNPITLTRNKNLELLPGIFIRTADNETLRYYIYKNVSIPGTYEIRGEIADSDFTWNPQNFAGFFYDLKKDIGTETITTVLSGDDGRKLSGDAPYGIIYTTTVQSKAYRYPPWGAYNAIGFMGDQYFAGYLQEVGESYSGSNIFYAQSKDDNSLGAEQLERILIDEKTNMLIKKGESIKLKEGYELVLKGVNDIGNIYVELLKNGKPVDSSFLGPSKDAATYFDKTYFYRKNVGEQEDLVIIGVSFRSTYKDEELSMAIVDALWQISETPIDVTVDNQYDKMTITGVDPSTGIIMYNKDEEINLTRKSDIHLMPGISIRTADNETLRYYIYRTEIVGKNSA